MYGWLWVIHTFLIQEHHVIHRSTNSNYYVSGLTILALSLVLFLVSRLCVLKINPNTKPSDRVIIKEKFWIDYLSYTFFVTLRPEVSEACFLRSMWKNSFSGLLLIITLTWGGFAIYKCYLTLFLSSLTFPYYEKPIRDIPGERILAL